MGVLGAEGSWEDMVIDGDGRGRAFIGRCGRRWGWLGVLGAERSWEDVDGDGWEVLGDAVCRRGWVGVLGRRRSYGEWRALGAERSRSCRGRGCAGALSVEYNYSWEDAIVDGTDGELWI